MAFLKKREAFSFPPPGWVTTLFCYSVYVHMCSDRGFDCRPAEPPVPPVDSNWIVVSVEKIG